VWIRTRKGWFCWPELSLAPRPIFAMFARGLAFDHAFQDYNKQRTNGKAVRAIKLEFLRAFQHLPYRLFLKLQSFQSLDIH